MLAVAVTSMDFVAVDSCSRWMGVALKVLAISRVGQNMCSQLVSIPVVSKGLGMCNRSVAAKFAVAI